MTVFLLAGIVCICIFLCLTEGAVWLWEKMEADEERREKRVREGGSAWKK